MHTVLKNVLSVNLIEQVNAIVAAEPLVDGRATSVVAGKFNLQLPMASDAAIAAGAIVVGALRANEAFNQAVHPAAIHPPLFSRYDVGMEYPDHIDVALMGGMRTDVAVTVFLSEMDSYEGGELVINTGCGIRRYRLQAGDAIAYPANTVHRVARVTRGTRLVAALWVQSMIRNPIQREILYDLGTLMRSLESTNCGARLRKSYWNLMRMWAETAALS